MNIPVSHGVTFYLCQIWPVLPLLVLMVLSPLVALLGKAGAADCVLQVPNGYQQQKHYFFHKDLDLPIIIEDSSRISHRITNRILKILLEKVAGYQSVKLYRCDVYDNQNITAILDRVAGITKSNHCERPRPNNNGVPDTMVNLETWMVAGFNKGPWLDTGKLLDAGPLGPQGRMGWFVPTSVVDSMWKKNKIVVDHWKAFEKQNIAKKFSWWGKEKLQETKPDYQSHAYLNKICQKNPNQKQRNCATLFASYLGVDAGVLRSQIEALNLRVDIVWLENKHHTFIKELDPTLPVLFFTWHPSSLLASGNYTRVHLPETHSPHKDSPSDCDFPVNQLTKVLWEPIKSGAPEAYHIISKLSFSDLEYDALIAQHPTYSEDEIACDWVNANKEKWDRWLPETLKEKTKIYIGGLFPLSGKSWAQPGLKEGASLAVELVNKDKSTLSDYNLTLIIEDTKCDYDLAMSEFISLTQRSPPIAAILGTGCSDPAERIAALSKHFNILMVSFGAEAHVLSDQDKYPYFFRTVPPVHHYIDVYVELFKRMGWKMIGAIAEDGQKLPEYHLILQKKLQYEDISLTVRRKFSNSSNTPDIAQILKEFKVQNVRVIIADVFSYVAREILCEAYKQKMTAYDGYVWFLPSWYSKDWYDVDFYNHPSSSREADTLKENVPCTTAEMEYATAGYFVLHKTNLAPPQTMVVGNITLDEYNQLYEKRFGTLYDKSKYASYVYDAVWVLAKGLDALLKSNHGALETIHTPKTASAFRAQISNVSFSGVSGWIKFTGSDRHSDLLIQQVFVNETVDMGLYIVGDGTKRPRLDTDKFKNRWYSPATETKDSLGNTFEECLIENFRAQLGVTCTIANVIVTVFVFFGFVIIAIIVPIIMKYRCDAKMKKFKATHERIKELGLLKDEFSPILTVDDWEIPRKDVVLNRVLGEGAFGTVMGGEMYKEREGWVAVAVKTLKLDHKLEEKLDFFREVEMMKSFKHENIVQLWGVCTRKEPMYAVMEFCLHGDLKTYLLSRRNLVGQGVKEAEDVKAENLTQMAVDVANGLNFLHSLKYVHRDIACRNCLVHANKTVKISDFGMTRHISSTDYYRFSRKAMLPVRWTAPEALKDGIYSSKSDIWSFGVLVFEIVTFGSFPYQGLSNKEVLDYVGRGSLLMLPDKCPDNLKSFIRWCMSPDPGYRPGLEDILSYLNFSPAFLAPCLDAPTTSIVHEDTDSLEMQANPHKTLSTSHSLSSSVPASSALSNHRHWPEKLKDKKKTSSVPGLNLVGKSAKSLQTRSPVSSARSLSMYSGIMNSSSVCGLNSCSVAGLTWGNEEEKEDEAAGETSVQGGAPKHKQREATLENNRVSVSIEYSCDKGESSSGYVSQTSSSEYKQICETVTSL